MLKKGLLVVMGLIVMFFALPALAQEETNVSSKKEIKEKWDKEMKAKLSIE